MKAVVLTGIRKMELRDVPAPRIEKDTDVLLRISAVGICGSDVHYYKTGRIGSQVVTYPYRVGHECSATVAEVGRGVKRLRPGDRVGVEPAVSCGECDQCRAGRQNTCRYLRFLGTPGQGDGCLCETIVMPDRNCFPAGTQTTLEQAAVAEPLSIGLYSVHMSIPLPGSAIGILGCGPIGLCVLLPALAQGAKKIYVTDRIDSRLDLARRMGAYWTGNPDRENVVDRIAEKEPLLLDAVFECCGQQEALDQAVQLLKPGGKLILVGIPEVDRVSFAIDVIRRKELCIQNIRRQNECLAPALEWIEEGKIDVNPKITHRFPMEKAAEAFDLVEGYRDGVVKAMIMM